MLFVPWKSQNLPLLTSKCSFNFLDLNCKSNWFKHVYDYDITSQHMIHIYIYCAAHSMNYANRQKLSIRDRNGYVTIFGARNLTLANIA